MILMHLDKLYNSSTDRYETHYYSKLAMLELCGWIEESMDDIVRCCANRNLNSSYNREVEREIIKPIHGFDYKNHFRKMLLFVIGLKYFHVLEGSIDPLILTPFISTLETLKTPRNVEAHSHINITRVVDAPSITLRNFNNVYRGLKSFERKLREIGF